MWRFSKCHLCSKTLKYSGIWYNAKRDESCVKSAPVWFLSHSYSFSNYRSLPLISNNIQGRQEIVSNISLSNSTAKSHVITPGSFCVAATAESWNSRYQCCRGQRDLNKTDEYLVEDFCCKLAHDSDAFLRRATVHVSLRLHVPTSLPKMCIWF